MNLLTWVDKMYEAGSTVKNRKNLHQGFSWSDLYFLAVTCFLSFKFTPILEKFISCDEVETIAKPQVIRTVSLQKYVS